MTFEFMRRDTDTQGLLIPCDDGGRHWRDAATIQRIPEARKRQGSILPYRFQRNHGPADTSILDF